MSTYEKISLIISCINILLSSGIIIQIVILLKQNRDSHEEQRRVKTIEMMMEWSKTLQKETSFTETIVEGLNHEQSKKLYEKIPFEVDCETKQKILEVCPNLHAECKQNPETGLYVIKGMLLTELRWYVIEYLNMLETIMAAWSLGIVDRDTIFQQYSYLYCEEKGWNVLEDFRKQAGKDAYPNIELFIEELKSKNRNKSASFKKLL